MKMTMRLGLVMSILLLLAACGKVQPLPELETAAVREGFRSTYESAQAWSESTDGCTVTYVYISAYKQRVKEVKGAKTEYNFADISLGNYNDCTWEGGFSIYGEASGANLSINKQLTKATLTATFEACKYKSDRRPACGPAELTITWTGEGKLSKDREKFQYKTPTETVKGMFKGTTRAANATGSFTFRGKTYKLNFDGSMGEAFLRSGKGSYVEMRK